MILDKLKDLKTKEKIALAVGLFFVFAWLVDLLVVRAISRAMVRYEQETRQARATLAYGDAVLAAKDQVVALHAKIADMLPKPASAAQAQDEMKGQVDALLAKAGIEFKSLEDRAPVKNPHHIEYFVEVGGIDTGMANLVKLLEELHQARTSAGMMRVVKLNLAPGKGNLKVKGSLTLSKAMLPADDNTQIQ